MLFKKVRAALRGKIKFFLPLVLFVLILLFAGIFAITQESDESLSEENLAPDDIAFDFLFDEGAEDPLPDWLPPGPPRWYKSNAGGMALEETPSRLAALRGKYALVIDYAAPHEIDPRLARFFQEGYTVEIRILYEQREESRRQWLFRDEEGVTRINAVFKTSIDMPNELPDDFESDLEQIAREEAKDDEANEEFDEAFDENIIEKLAEISEEETVETEAVLASPGDIPDEGIPSPDEPPPGASNRAEIASLGFIEFYNEKSQIIEDRWLYEDDSELMIRYIYNGNTLIQSETWETMPELSPVKMHTDTLRYNRSYSLRYVERRYHVALASAGDEPVRLTFPSRVLEAAAGQGFLSDTLYLVSDFFGNFSVGEGYRMVYDTDDKGRLMIQTLFDSNDEVVWIINNTWAGDRITSARKIEGEDEKITEYEYDNAGNRIVMRDIHNGIIERLTYTQGEQEVEELYLNGVLAMKAYWEDGRKISEERVRRQ